LPEIGAEVLVLGHHPDLGLGAAGDGVGWRENPANSNRQDQTGDSGLHGHGVLPVVGDFEA
jgi:hypothetical protein